MGLIDTIGNITAQQMQNRANVQMSDTAYARDIEMWNRGNEYNNPVNQMKRLKDAGLNPNLVYGNGSVVGNTTTQLPKYNTPRMEYSFRMENPLSEISQYSDLKIKQLQADNLLEQNKSIALDNVIKSVEAEWKPYNAEIDWMRNVRQSDALMYQNRRISQTLEGQIRKDNALVAPTIEKSQADAQSADIERRLKEVDLKYRDWGVPAVNNLINFIRLLKP